MRLRRSLVWLELALSGDLRSLIHVVKRLPNWLKISVQSGFGPKSTVEFVPIFQKNWGGRQAASRKTVTKKNNWFIFWIMCKGNWLHSKPASLSYRVTFFFVQNSWEQKLKAFHLLPSTTTNPWWWSIRVVRKNRPHSRLQPQQWFNVKNWLFLLPPFCL